MASNQTEKEEHFIYLEDTTFIRTGEDNRMFESDFFYSVYCTLCGLDGVNNDAEKFCCQCDLFMCSVCLTQHGRFPILNVHNVTDAQERMRTEDRTGNQTRCGDVFLNTDDSGGTSDQTGDSLSDNSHTDFDLDYATDGLVNQHMSEYPTCDQIDAGPDRTVQETTHADLIDTATNQGLYMVYIPRGPEGVSSGEQDEESNVDHKHPDQTEAVSPSLLTRDVETGTTNSSDVRDAKESPIISGEYLLNLSPRRFGVKVTGEPLNATPTTPACNMQKMTEDEHLSADIVNIDHDETVLKEPDPPEQCDELDKMAVLDHDETVPKEPDPPEQCGELDKTAVMDRDETVPKEPDPPEQCDELDKMAVLDRDETAPKEPGSPEQCDELDKMSVLDRDETVSKEPGPPEQCCELDKTAVLDRDETVPKQPDPSEQCGELDKTAVLDRVETVPKEPGPPEQWGELEMTMLDEHFAADKITINRDATVPKEPGSPDQCGELDKTVVSDVSVDEELRSRGKLQCPEHEDERIKVFCVTHQALCCSVCIWTKHKYCEPVQSLKEAARDTSNKERIEKLPEELRTLHHFIAAVLNARKMDKHNVDNQKDAVENRLSKYRTELEACLDSLSNNTHERLNTRYASARTSIDEDIGSLEDILAELEQALRDLNCTVSEETLYFITSIQSMALRQNKETDLKKYQRLVAKEQLICTFSEQVKTWLEYLTDLGEFREEINPISDKPLAATLHEEFKVPEGIKYVTDVHALDTGHTLVSAANPNKLLILDAEFKIKTEYSLMTWQPNQICEINSNILAIALEESVKAGKILVISVPDTIKVEYSLFVGPGCRGVAYLNGMLFVTRGGRFLRDTHPNIHVFNMFGSSIRVFDLSELTIPRHIVVSPDKRHLYLADEQKGLVKCDHGGHIISIHSTTGMKLTTVVAKPRNEYVFFIDNKTNVFYMEFRKKEPVLLLKSTDVVSPRALAYGPDENKLTVFGEKMIKVYKLDETLTRQPSLTSESDLNV